MSQSSAAKSSRAARTVLFTVALGVLVTLSAFFLARHWESRRDRVTHEQSAAAVAKGLEESLNAVSVRMDALTLAFRADPNSQALSNLTVLPGETLIAWAPIQTAATNAVFEFDANGKRIPAAHRPDYHPIQSLAPANTLEQFRGLDIASLPGAIDTLLRARERRTLCVSEPAQFPPSLGVQGPACLALLPVFESDGKTERGVLVSIIALESFLNARTAPWLQQGSIYLDASAGGGKLWSSPSAPGFSVDESVALLTPWGGRQWRFAYQPLAAKAGMSPAWLILLLGVLVTPLLAVALSRVVEHRDSARRLNETQTAALSKEMADRLEAEAALREKQDAFQNLFENTGDLILSFSGEGKVLLANPSCVRVLGYSAEELNGILMDQLLAPADRAAFDTLLREWSESAPSRSVELALHSKQGARVIVEGEWNAERSGSKLLSVRAILRDITERRRIEAELRRSQDSLSALVENTQDAIWSVDSTLKLQSFNTPFADLHHEFAGTPVQIGTDHLSLLDPENRQAWKQMYERALAGERITLERTERIGGQQRTFLISLSPILSAGSTTGVTVYRKDITEQKKLDNALRALVEGTVNATGAVFFNLLAKHLADALSVGFAYLGDLQPDGERIRILGFHPETGSARVSEFTARDSVADVAAVKGSAHVAFGVRRMFPRDTLMQEFNAEGALTVALRAGNGALLGVMGVFHDEPLNVTPDTHTVLRVFAARASAEIQRKNAEAALAQARDAAIASARMKTEFLANMSHEIRTPINGIIGMTELLEGTQLPQESQRYLGNIRSCSDLLLTLIDDILDFSKIEAGKLEIEPVDFDLPRLVGECVGLFANASQAKGIRLFSDVSNGVPPLVRGDSLRIRQILNNLLSNAIKFTQAGSVRVAIEALESSGTHTHLRFSVKDSGIGISPEAQQRLFNPFVQADGSTTRRFGGSGLGLSICKRLVELMGGEIGVESTAGQGAEFWFALRLEHADRTDSALTKVTPARAEARAFVSLKDGAPSASNRAKVLVVEDNPINQQVAKSLLERLDCHVELANNGREGLDRLRDERFDIVFMDCQMPVMDGYEATAAIREHEKNSGAARSIIVAMTAHALPTERAHCLDCGMDDYAAKPISRAILHDLLTRWVPTFSRPRDAKPMAQSVLAPEPDQSLDLTRLREAGGDSEGMRRLVQLSMKQLTSRVETVRAARIKNDVKEIARVAHMCVGSCGACGMNRLATLWQRLEQCAGAAETHALDALIADVEAELHSVGTRMADFLNAETAR